MHQPGSFEVNLLGGRGKGGEVENAGGARTTSVDDPPHALRRRTIRLHRGRSYHDYDYVSKIVKIYQQEALTFFNHWDIFIPI